MSVGSWLRVQAIRAVVARIKFEEVRVNKWILAAIALAVAFCGGIAGSLEAGTLTVGALTSAGAAALLAFAGKLYDPGSTIVTPRLLKALGLALAAGVGLIGAAVQDGTINASEWGGVAVTFFTVFWAKWSTPDKITS